LDVRLISETGVEHRAAADLETLLKRDDALVWVDIPSCDPEATRVLAETFGFHHLAIRDCQERNSLPKVHLYPDHAFVVLHAPERGTAGHVHFLELDQFIGPGYLVTVHGPLNPSVDPGAAQVETDHILNRIEAGRLRPTSSYALSFAIVTALVGRLRAFVETLTREVWRLEQRVTAGHFGDPEQFLDEMFRARHGLLTVRTMASLSRAVYGRMLNLKAFGEGEGEHILADLVDQFDRIHNMADSQRDYLHGVIEFYQTRTNIKMTIAAERLAVIAAVTLPVTALSSVLGMNLIVNGETQWGALTLTLAVMAAISTALLIWAKRKGWW
jgi:magnesium transporter